MKIATVRVGLSRTFNLGDFNSVKIEVALEADMEEGDLSSQAAKTLFTTARDEIREEYLIQTRKKAATSQANEK